MCDECVIKPEPRRNAKQTECECGCGCFALTSNPSTPEWNKKETKETRSESA